MIFRFAIRNLARFPWRSLLYGCAVFFIVLAMTASFFVQSACQDTAATLAEDYVFVASLVKRSTGNDFSLAEVIKCLDYPGVVAFNTALSYENGVIPEGRTLNAFPERTEGEEADFVLIPERSCPIQGVENLALVYSFFSGECTIREGTGITKQGYMGEAEEIVIPWHLADRHGIRVGDTVNRRYYRTSVGDDGYLYIPTVVVGIYETSAKDPDTSDYPAYMPLAVTELDFGELLPQRLLNVSEHHMALRADFVLESRESFADFVAFAKENDVNFQNANLVFNNSTYDVLASEIGNVNMIASIVFVAVITVGLGIMIFFTVYLCHSREKEYFLLSSLGMKKSHIRGMIALELLLLLVVCALLGIGVGNHAANALCQAIDDTVLARASVSEEIRDVSSASDFEITMPLEKNIRLRIFEDETERESKDLEWNRIVRLAENEIGVSKHRLYVYKTDSEFQKYKPPYVPTIEDEMEYMTRDMQAVDLIGITDLSAFLPHDGEESVTSGVIRLYVSESFLYRDERALFLCRFNSGDTFFNDISYTRLMQGIWPTTYRVLIAGTYEENEFFSGNDVLVHMDDYHALYQNISITDSEYYFTRISERWENLDH